MIETRRVGAVEWITLNAPARHNALDWAGIGALKHFVEKAGANPVLRALVITGTGKSFCSGADLSDVAKNDWSNNPLTPLCDAIEACPLPTICALNGGVYGGGVEIALSCDFRFGVQRMKLRVPAATLGIHYPAKGLARAINALGLQNARRIFLLGETFNGAALRDVGFVERLGTKKGLDERVGDFANELAALAPLAVQGMKLTLNELARGDLNESTAQKRTEDCFASADHQEGLQAHQERRAPRFTGK